MTARPKGSDRGRRAGRRGALAILAAVVAAAAGAALWLIDRSPPPGPGALRGADILLITIDTLRADRVGTYGGGQLTPALDHLAAGGVWFERAYTHVPMTLPAHASILTGLTPPGHGVRNNGTFRLGERHTTLAELARRAGYRTGAFVGAFVLDARFGLDQGFDMYDDEYGRDADALDFNFAERRADVVLDRAAAWILDGDRPWFAWIHLFDPHAPYDAPERQVADPYDNEVAYTDAQLARFLGRLRAHGALDRALVIVTADHGEALGDHGETTHGLFAYESTIRVPLVVSGPGIRPGRSRTPVSHADLLPTIADLAGLDTPPGLHGRSLVPAVNGRPGSGGPVYFEALDANLTRNWAPLTGLIVDKWKYIDLPIEELYRPDADPAEQDNLAERRPADARELRRRLDAARSALTQGREERADLDAGARERLRALGYVGGSAPEPRAAPFTEADDPKTLLPLHERFMAAIDLARDGDRRRALGELEAIIAIRSDFVQAYTSAASLLIQESRAGEAVALLDRFIERGLSTPELIERLGAALLAAGRFQRAVTVLAPFVASPRATADASNTLAVAYAELGQLGEARAQLTRALALAPGDAALWSNLGLVELRAGDRNAAEQAFRAATDADPDYAPGWRGRGAALAGERPAEAVEAWTQVLRLDPADYDTLFNLGMTLAELRPAAARPYLRRFLDEAPPARYADDFPVVRRKLAELEGGR